MHSITTALENLTRQLSQEIPATPGLCVFDAPFPLNDAFDALSWLASQSSFPQFYWQQRNGDEEAAVLGAITVFSSLDLAQRFLRQHAQPDLRIWGLNAFEPKEGYLLLPRLEWRRSGGTATLRLHLHSDVSLRDDARQAKAFLASLVGIKPVPALRLSLTSEQHWPDKDGWVKLIQQATHTIAQEAFDKVVLARATDLQFSRPVNAAAMMASSRRLNLNCYHFFMAFSADTAFLGSSPERLWRRRETALRTEALAGTVANHPDNHKAWQLGEWLMKDDKTSEKICWLSKTSASDCKTAPTRWMCCRRRCSDCARYSICAAVSGRRLIRRTTRSACTSYSLPQRSRGSLVNPRVVL